MCGILFDFKNISELQVNLLGHRGPDGKAVFSSNEFHFGHTRLSIIDPSMESAQPMQSISGNSVITFNGEIYNYKQLRNELSEKGVPFKSKGDTEVVLNGIEREGESFINKLDGMFAFVWVDLTTKKIVLGRDKAGKNPLYYSTKNGLTIASEIRTLLSLLGEKNEINDLGLQQYVRYGIIPEPLTLWKDVFLFPSGCIGIYEYHELKIIPQEFKTIVPKSNISHEDSKSKIRELLIQSVERRLVSDVEVGTFLSGGIDSSLLVGLMTDVFKLKPKTFSVIFDQKEHSEEERIKKVVGHWKPDHQFVELNLDNVRDEITNALTSYDHPSIDGVNTYMVSKAVREKGLKVALSGLGGDELFQGYNTFNQARKILRYQSFLSLIPNHLFSNQSSFQRAKESAKTYSIFQPMSSIRSLYSEYEIKKIFGETYVGWHPIISQHDEFRLRDLSGDSLLIGQEWFGYMKNMLIRDTNIMSMANGLEVRAPFTDRDLLDFVLTLPDEIKRPKTVKKQLLVKACQPWLLPEIVESSKMGFLLPMRDWLLGSLKYLIEDSIVYLSESDKTKPLVRVATTQLRLLEKNQTTWSRVWQWIVLAKVLKDGLK